MKKISYKGVPVPPEIIQQAIWLYVRFTLSFRDVEDLLAERGRTVVSSVIVSDDGSEYVMVALDSGETVTGLLASKWEPQQGPPRHPKSRPLISLLDATAPEKPLVGSVLFDIRRFPRLRSVLRFFMLQGCVLGDLWVTAARTLGRPVSRRNWRHMAAHEFAPDCSHRNGLPLDRASHPNNFSSVEMFPSGEFSLAADLRRRQQKPHATWHFDEVYL
jgi:hypothetical protein